MVFQFTSYLYYLNAEAEMKRELERKEQAKKRNGQYLVDMLGRQRWRGGRAEWAASSGAVAGTGSGCVDDGDRRQQQQLGLATSWGK